MSTLALDGGAPLRSSPFPSWPLWDSREEQALLDVLHSGTWGIAAGDSPIQRFERAFAAAHDAAHGRAQRPGVADHVAVRQVGTDEAVPSGFEVGDHHLRHLARLHFWLLLEGQVAARHLDPGLTVGARPARTIMHDEPVPIPRAALHVAIQELKSQLQEVGV